MSKQETKVVSFRMDPEDYKKLCSELERRHTTLAKYLRFIAEREVERLEQGEMLYAESKNKQ
ncbi:MAG: hypothetical protein ACRCZZ_08275 [Phocaeicola sp.]